MNIMFSFWEAIDVAENSRRGLQAVKGIYGSAAALMMVPITLLIIALGQLSWYFDLSATSEWTQHAVKEIWSTIPQTTAAFIGWSVVCVIIMPTLVELFMARFALSGIKFAAIVVFGMALFDMITDWPRVVQFMTGYAKAFDTLGMFGGVVFFVVKLLWLFLASFAFESLFLVMCVVWFALLANIRGPRYDQRNNNNRDRNKDRDRNRDSDNVRSRSMTDQEQRER